MCIRIWNPANSCSVFSPDPGDNHMMEWSSVVIMTLSYSGYVKYHYVIVAAPILISAPTIRKLSVYGTFSKCNKAMMKRSSVAIMNLSYNGYIQYRHN